MKTIVLHPEYVVSKNDGDFHYIGNDRLLQLYNIPRSKYLIKIYDSNRPETLLGFINSPEYIHLYPRFDGKYEDYGILD